MRPTSPVRSQPLVELGSSRPPVVAAGDPRPAHLDLADRLAVVRQRVAGVVDDPRLDAAHRPALRGPQRPVLVARGIPAAATPRWPAATSRSSPRPARSARRCFCSKPSSATRGTADPPQATSRSDEMSWPGAFPGSAARRSRWSAPRRPRSGRCVSMRSISDAGVEEPVRQHQVGAGHQRGVRQPPGVGVEHRHDRQHRFAAAQPERVGRADVIECR